MDIVVRGRGMDVSDRFREYAAQKLGKVERYDGKRTRIDVELSQEKNPRLADQAVRVEITAHGKGPVIRAEAAADEQYAALDVAFAKLEERLRRAADKRHDHGRRAARAMAVAVATAETAAMPGAGESGGSGEEQAGTGGIDVQGEGPLVVREKTHVAPPMTLDQALYQMELVGHDFYLYQDQASGSASVVYRRKGYDYGVLHLAVEDAG